MDYTKKRWITLVFSCIINLCIGSIYAWSVFSTPMAQYLTEITESAMTAESLALVFTVANAVGPITMIAGGSINDRFGPRRVILVGGLLFGGGMFLCSFAKSILPLAVCYGLGCGLGMGMVGPMVSMITLPQGASPSTLWGPPQPLYEALPPDVAPSPVPSGKAAVGPQTAEKRGK